MTIHTDQDHATPLVSAAAPSMGSPSVAMRASGQSAVLVVLRLLQKHLLLLVVCLVAGLTVALILNMLTPPEYTASANMQLTQDSANQFRLEQVAGGDIDGARIDTDIEVLQSSTLALQTITSLHLAGNSKFIVQRSGQPWNLTSSTDRQTLESVFIRDVTAKRLGHTNIIHIDVTSLDPKLAAVICNELILNFREHSFKDDYTATEEVSKWLQAQLGELKHHLEASQNRLLSLQRDIGFVGIDQSQSIASIRLEGLSRDLSQAEADRLVLQAKLIALRNASPGVVDTLSADPILLQLRQRKAALADDYAGLLSKYGVGHPRVIDAGLQMEQLDRAIRAEESNAVQKVQGEVDAAVLTENTLRRTLGNAKEQAYAGNSEMIAYSLARREYEADRTLYDGLQARLQEAGIIASLHSSSIRVIDAADVPSSPSKPRKAFNSMTGLLTGLTLGVVIALLIESLDTHIRTIADVEDDLGLPLLGVIPRVDAGELRVSHFIASASQSGTGSWSQIAESYRSLRTALLLSRPGTPPQVMMISSSQPAEGKTSVASLVSILLAISGARVLLVDADLRRPSIHTVFELPNQIGLSSILTNHSQLHDSLCRIEALPLLTVLPAGPAPPMPAELLGSTQMLDLLRETRTRFDFIVIDTPPALTVTDAAVLASMTDGVVLVLRYGKTGRNAVARASVMLDRAGSRVLGVVINAADHKSHDYADYYGSSYNTYYESGRSERTM